MPITSADVTNAKRNDPPPEPYTDLFGEKKVLHVHGIDISLSTAALARATPLLSTKNVEPVLVVDGRATACRVGTKSGAAGIVFIRCGPTTTTSVTVKNGEMERHEHTSEDYIETIMGHLTPASSR